MRRARTIVAAAAVVLTSASALAAQTGRPAGGLVISAQNVTAAEAATAGKPRPNGSVLLPGDVVEYRLVFTNTTGAVVKDVGFQDPLPAGVAYVAGSAGADRADAVVEYSIDRGASWSGRPEIEVVVAGQRVRQPAPAEQYTHVRWRVAGSVAPAAKVEARFRARVKG